MKIKNTLKKNAIFKQYLKKRNKKKEAKEYSRFLTDNNKIDNRIKYKKSKKEKINVLFICHRPAVWGALKTVYESLLQNDMFDVKVIAIPKVNIYTGCIDDEGASEYFKKYNAINGYVNGKYIDLKIFNPDFVFFQQPYNSAMPLEYRSNIVSRYSKICYIDYFSFNNNVKSYDVFYECVPKDFVKDISLYFVQTDHEKDVIKDWLKDTPNNIQYVTTGYPKYDNIASVDVGKCKIWCKNDELFRVIWTPRWCTNENNCHFLLYKDKLLELVKRNKRLDFVFRPHPQSWLEWKRSGNLNTDEEKEYIKQYGIIENAHIDNEKEYLSLFYSSNCLVTDFSSIITEYYLTGKPIIYCESDNSLVGFKRSCEFSKGLYWAYTWDEVERYINMLMQGNDPLKKKRDEYISNFLSQNKFAGNIISECISKYVNNI